MLAICGIPLSAQLFAGSEESFQGPFSPVHESGSARTAFSVLAVGDYGLLSYVKVSYLVFPIIHLVCPCEM